MARLLSKQEGQGRAGMGEVCLVWAGGQGPRASPRSQLSACTAAFLSLLFLLPDSILVSWVALCPGRACRARGQCWPFHQAVSPRTRVLRGGGVGLLRALGATDELSFRTKLRTSADLRPSLPAAVIPWGSPGAAPGSPGQNHRLTSLFS